MKKLCIIPARGRSKRIRDKNICLLDKKPLINYTIDAVQRYFHKVIIASDSKLILEIAKSFKDYAPIRCDNIELMELPESTTGDDIKVIESIKYVYNSVKKEEYNQIWYALPTCPLRTKEDVSNAMDLLTEDVDGVISITDYEFPPTLGMIIYKENGKEVIRDWHISSPWARGNTRTQDHEKIYRPNGGIYGRWTKAFEGFGDFYKGYIKPYYMPRERSVDIDTKFDLQFAEFLIRQGKKK